MRLVRPRRARMAISGIVASLIMFVMLFTVGTGYFLWINANNATFSQAQANRNNLNQAQQAESISLCPGTYSSGVCSPSLTSANHLQFGATNLGSSTSFLVYFYVIDATGTVQKQGQIIPNLVMNAGSQSPSSCSQCDTGSTYTSGVMSIKVVTQRGNTFTTNYPVQKASPSPSVFTLIQPSSTIPLGQSVYDAATLLGVTPKAGGTVTYNYFANGGCSGSPSTSAVVTVTNGNVPSSNTQAQGTQTPSTTGSPGSPASYSWDAVYSGDANNAGPDTSSCEPLTVTPSLTTSLSSPSVTSPGSVQDSASISGVTMCSPSCGTVTFYYSTVNSCPASGATKAGSTVTITGNGPVATSGNILFSTPGVYYWYATYSGDSNNLPTTSPCEPLVVSSAGQTQIPFEIQLNNFRFYYGGGFSLGNGLPVGGYFAYSFPGGAAGVYQFKITNVDPLGRDLTFNDESFVYDTNLQSSGNPHTSLWYIVGDICTGTSGNPGCGEPYTGAVGVTSFASRWPNGLKLVSGASVLLNFSASNVEGTDASVSVPSSGTHDGLFPYMLGFYSDNTPFTLTVGFTGVFGSNAGFSSCTNTCGGAANSQLSITFNGFSKTPNLYFVDNAGTISSLPWVGTCSGGSATCSFTVPSTVIAGKYYMIFANDGTNYAYATLRGIKTTSISTSLTQSVIAHGGSVSDSASLSGATPTAGGTVTYYYYTNGACSSGQTTVNTVTVTNGANPNSNSHTFNQAGAFSWNAAYSGDVNNGGSTSACEPLTVTTGLTINPTTFAHATGSHTVTVTASNLQTSTSFSYCLSTSSSSVSCVSSSIGSPSPGTFTSTAGGAIPSGTVVVTTSAITSGTYYMIIYQGSQIIGFATLTVT